VAIVDVAGLQLVSVRPDDTVAHAIARMADEDVGCVVACEGSRLAGIFTERDVLRLARRGARFEELRVGEAMTRRVVTAAADDEILDVARLMGEHRIRHVPVVEGENVLGVVGIRDVLGVLAERLWREHDAAARETIHGLLSTPSRPDPGR
jgi:CBS domain-containing protein